MRFWFLTAIFLSGPVLSAPDEDLLGKAENYPVCPLVYGPTQQRCLVGTYSNFDQVVPARRVAKGSHTQPLKKSDRELDLRADAFMDNNRNTGLLVMKGDTILAERYQYDRKPEHRFTSMSMAKTVVSMLIGISLKDGVIKSIDDKAEIYVPGLKGHPYGETSLRHLLTMSSGVKFTERYDGTDDMTVLSAKTFFQKGPGGVDTVLSFTERARPAGERFVYASAETQVRGLVLRAATGKPIADYLSEKIWQPMGAEADATWLLDAGGHEIAYCCLNATLRDWGRFGLLLANDGAFDGKQIIPAAWIRAATTPDAPFQRVGRATRNNGYGYQTWLISSPQRRFALLGVRGQAVFVDPDLKLVVVHTAIHASARDDAARGNQFRYLDSVLSKLEQ